ncbi:hypothetical protein P153DRAFT_389432 [Dothidotthia symphoricarpi CBS 119687]|uniref:Uncharacterized protein n=1 Tax=Dothidotthia symphoricarpi CBS 119687 TaxID=1392245 RepID=A0A6A5ZZU2_9PLEO|nr:uncharacterized protein P153DRAFT_389432 [Dothidotthia symphoricarpi CBS 119687]KAF2125272.1 hypothetical protein P153DRAFT_389432 [Dothidotthia symphoricarpi CBS 119687]
MPPTHDGSFSSKTWDSSTTLEFITLMLAIPGTLVALVTLWIVLSQNFRERVHYLALTTFPYQQPLIRRRGTDRSDTEFYDGFQERYRELHGEVSSEREQWAEEMTDLSSRR